MSKKRVSKRAFIKAIKDELPMWDYPQYLTIMAFLGCVGDRAKGGDGSFRERKEAADGTD